MALFAEGQYFINEYFSTTLGLRYNYSDIFNAIPNPRFFVNFNPADWLTFKAGISSGVLVPNLEYLYEGWNSALTVYGNQNLRPEQSWNYEVSAIADFEPAMFILTGYYTDFKDKIQSVPYTDNTCSDITACSTYRNVDKSLIAGAEATLKIKPIYGISLDANYAYTYTKILSTVDGDIYQGEPLNRIPLHNFTIKPMYQKGNFNAYIRWQGKYKTPTPTPTANTAGGSERGAIGKYYKDYQIVDIAASYKFLKDYTLTFAINNLFDVDFYDPILYQGTRGLSVANQYQRILPSRTYWISFRAEF